MSPPISFISPSLACVVAALRSVHHGSVLLCVFDSHLLSFLSLTALTARPKLDWTVTHRATGENKPPVLGPRLKSQHHWIMAPPPPPHSRTLPRINNTQTQQHPHTVHCLKSSTFHSSSSVFTLRWQPGNLICVVSSAGLANDWKWLQWKPCVSLSNPSRHSQTQQPLKIDFDSKENHSNAYFWGEANKSRLSLSHEVLNALHVFLVAF